MNPLWASPNRSPEIAHRAASVGCAPMGPETAGRHFARRYAVMQGVLRSEASRFLRRKCGATHAPTRIATAHERFATGWHKGEAARLLQVSRPTLDAKIKRFGIDRPTAR